MAARERNLGITIDKAISTHKLDLDQVAQKAAAYYEAHSEQLEPSRLAKICVGLTELEAKGSYQTSDYREITKDTRRRQCALLAGVAGLADSLPVVMLGALTFTISELNRYGQGSPFFQPMCDAVGYEEKDDKKHKVLDKCTKLHAALALRGWLIDNAFIRGVQNNGINTACVLVREKVGKTVGYNLDVSTALTKLDERIIVLVKDAANQLKAEQKAAEAAEKAAEKPSGSEMFKGLFQQQPQDADQELAASASSAAPK